MSTVALLKGDLDRVLEAMFQRSTVAMSAWDDIEQ